MTISIHALFKASVNFSKVFIIIKRIYQTANYKRDEKIKLVALILK